MELDIAQGNTQEFWWLCGRRVEMLGNPYDKRQQAMDVVDRSLTELDADLRLAINASVQRAFV